MQRENDANLSEGHGNFALKLNGTGLWNGRIDEVALFERALDVGEIAALYKAACEQLAAIR